MLTPELVVCELPISKMTPQDLFITRRILTWVASSSHEAGDYLINLGGEIISIGILSPLILSKLGRGNNLSRPRKIARHAALHVRAAGASRHYTRRWAPSPFLKGRGLKVRDWSSEVGDGGASPANLNTSPASKVRRGAFQSAFFSRRFGNRRSLVALKTNSPGAQKDRKADDTKTTCKSSRSLRNS